MNPSVAQIIDQARTQFDATGIVLWLFDQEGGLVASTKSAAWLWKSEAVLEVAKKAQPAPGEVAPGLFACSIGLEEPCRGMTMVLAAAAPSFIDSPLCPAADGSPAAAELHAFTRFQADSAPAVLNMARSWVRDICKLADSGSTIEGFTAQLSQAFDNIDCLYAMGRAMHDPTKPKEFLRFVCDRLRHSTDFAWIAARFTGDDHDIATLTDKFYLSGTPEAEVSDVVRVSGEFANKNHENPGAQILASVAGLSPASNPQVLVHPIMRGVGPGGVLLAGEKTGPDEAISSWDIQLFEAAAGFIASYLENVALFEEQRRLFMGTLQALTAAIDAKDRYTRGHSERVAHISSLLAREIGMSEEEVERIRIAGLVHDVGKIGVPEAVLCKQGKLSDAEFDAIKRHPQIGFGILQDIPPLQDVLPGVLHHHERWDGRGYPSGLSRQRIPMQARIIAVADTFDAMSSTRSYRPAMPRDTVLAEMKRCAGSQFDPELVPAFLRLDLTQYDLLVAKHAALETAPAALPEIPTQLAA